LRGWIAVNFDAIIGSRERSGAHANDPLAIQYPVQYGPWHGGPAPPDESLTLPIIPGWIVQ
jgi:hypothetical protein